MQDFHETAHVGASDSVGKIHVHIDGSHRVLESIPPIPDRDGVSQIFDSHLVDGNVSVIPLVLNINHEIT